MFKVVPEIPPTARSDRSANPTISAVLVAARKYKIKDTNLSAAIIRGCNTRHHAHKHCYLSSLWEPLLYMMDLRVIATRMIKLANISYPVRIYYFTKVTAYPEYANLLPRFCYFSLKHQPWHAQTLLTFFFLSRLVFQGRK